MRGKKPSEYESAGVGGITVGLAGQKHKVMESARHFRRRYFGILATTTVTSGSSYVPPAGATYSSTRRVAVAGNQPLPSFHRWKTPSSPGPSQPTRSTFPSSRRLRAIDSICVVLRDPRSVWLSHPIACSVHHFDPLNRFLVVIIPQGRRHHISIHHCSLLGSSLPPHHYQSSGM